MLYKPQKDFPHIERYKKVFHVTPYTIFAYDDTIYTDYPLPRHLEIHEQRHLVRQQKIGVDLWVDKYLTDKDFRLNEEVISYKEQCNSIKDRNQRDKLRKMCAIDLSSALYGGIISDEDAYKLLCN